MLCLHRLQTLFGGTTSVDGQGITGKVNLIFMVSKRSELGNVAGIVRK